MELLIKYLIICPLSFIAGFIDAVAGGGGLVSLPAYMLAGIPVHNCVATNKVSSIMGTSVATAKYARDGFISLKYALVCVPCAFIGAGIGANIALLISAKTFKIIMLIIIPLTAIYVFTKKDLFPKNEERSKVATFILSGAIALVIGAYDGFYGPGAGMFMILLLTALAGLELNKANGLAKTINFTTNLSSLIVYLMNGQVLIQLGLIAGMFNVAGNYIGATRFEKSGAAIVKPVLIVVLTVFMIKLILELGFGIGA